MSIQRSLVLNIDPNNPPDQLRSPKPTHEPTALSSAAGQLPGVENEGRTSAAVLRSISSAVAGLDGIDLSDSHLSFAVDEETGATVISIVDDETDEVIRQIPHDDILKLKKAIGEMQGLVLDRKA